MGDFTAYSRLLSKAWIDDAVFELRPDYRALLVVVERLAPGPSDEASEDLLRRAEESVRTLQAESPVEELPHIASWHEAFRAFGAKPKRILNSAEALIRRAEAGLPRINRLTDIYNAVSVLHRVPLGGENLDAYQGAPRLVRASGDEAFNTVAGGEPVVEHPKPGEVAWCDEAGVTCRRWNWRQGTRTQLKDDTTAALFILDGLDPLTGEDLHAAADDLITHLSAFSPGLQSTRRLLSADDAG